MRRVAVTGIGIVSSIGNNADEVVTSLREARSGVSAAPEYKDSLTKSSSSDHDPTH